MEDIFFKMSKRKGNSETQTLNLFLSVFVSLHKQQPLLSCSFIAKRNSQKSLFKVILLYWKNTDNLVGKIVNSWGISMLMGIGAT